MEVFVIKRLLISNWSRATIVTLKGERLFNGKLVLTK